jgi:LmbE family N-acetylglucosaminyl deacetylase
MKRLFFTLIYIAVTLTANAQQVRPASSEKIYHELAQLRHLTNVLYVAAHPDDENTRLLAWLVNDKNIRTAYLSLTRGDGGQNILGSEQGQALGLIRTHELMEARKIDGAEQFFSRAIDFGFSKTYQETFQHWPEYLLTSDAVWVMRKFRPDVVICRFPPNTMAGHGQHAASAIIAADAFKVAGNKMQYTEQLKYYSAWQPKRLLLNTYRFGDRNTTSEDQFKLQVGQYLPFLGMGSGELAGLSRSVHKSQGAGTPAVAGVQTEYFKLVDGDSLSESLFDGIDITWGRVGRTDISDDLKEIADNFNFRHPDASLPALLALRKKVLTVTDEYWRKEKLEELDHVILDCTGLMAELYARQPQTVKGASLPFTLNIIARSHTAVNVSNIKWGGSDSVLHLTLPDDTLLTLNRTIAIPADAALTQPYWMISRDASADIFSIPEDTLLGLPETPNPLNAMLTVNVGGTDFILPVPLSYKKTDPVKGDVVEQLRIVPDVTVDFSSYLLISRPGIPLQADVKLHAFKNMTNATLHIYGSKAPGDILILKNIDLPAGTDTIVSVNVSPAQAAAQGSDDFYLCAELEANGVTYKKAQHTIQYNHLPTLQYFTTPAAKVLHANWKCTVSRIGYIEGAGDYIPTLLRLAGLQVDVLKENDLTNSAKLKKYDAIVTGIRAVNVEKRMAYWLPVLFDYVKNGGTLLMQYNTTQDLSTTKLGPYPFTVAADQRVTEENARITFIDTRSKILNYPNKITDNDFNDWVQERGLYFLSKFDDRYTPLFLMNDEGEQPLNGATLWTKYGRGNYIYTSLSFNRQLPAGNKGAIRLFMNMLSVGK